MTSSCVSLGRQERRDSLLRTSLAQRPDLWRSEQLIQRFRVAHRIRRPRRVGSGGLLLFVLRHQTREHQLAVRVARKRHLPVHHLFHQLRRRIVSHKLRPRHAERVQRPQLLHKRRVLRNAIRMQLPIDPLPQPHRLHILGVARARAEGQAVECLQDLLVIRICFRNWRASAAFFFLA